MSNTIDSPIAGFARRLLHWHRDHGRHDLPWQQPRSPYRVWLSEIMLQQTQVATVIPYFQRFVAELPDLPALARAPLDQVLALWSGLGYYSRARNLHAAARHCRQHHGGELPDDFEQLLALPGIGRSTAGAILAQAWGRRAAILDGNVKRLLCRSHGIEGWPGTSAVEKRLWQLSQALLPDDDLADYTQAVMDFGATVCSRHRPACGQCVLAADCLAQAHGMVEKLPTPRPRKTLPQRQANWLLLLDDRQRILLGRRPESGIWGGLWSLPEYPDRSSLDSDLALRLAGDALPALEQLPAVRHVFSHYVLIAQPWRGRLSRSAGTLADGDRHGWFASGELDRIGLPQPVRRLLQRPHP
ncbi:MAG: A/G-specific adenine glycosylase [Xanthomonadales bacterium]|nr:A/G-specific adenine glycosylase [Xanthomonadales bacterium]